jgi:hypothetical protein
MNITMRVHSLTLPIDARAPEALLYRVDDVKQRKERGWTDRLTLCGTDLALGDIVIVTVVKELDRSGRTEPVTPAPHHEGDAADESPGGAVRGRGRA